MLVYGLGVPSLYCALLARCRHDIQAGASTPLSDALAFLHAAFEPRALWWPLVEALRAVLLTGFLALVSPGTVTQLFLGVLVALACALVQIWSVPYRAPENNLVAAVASAGLVLSYAQENGLLFKVYRDQGLTPRRARERFLDLARAVYRDVRLETQALMHSGQGDSNHEVTELLLIARDPK